MTLYEELGVPRDAAQDTIHDAYRNVARILHPDAQTNPVLKESAEAQMKRINHLYDILSDPERRRRYDQELTEPERPGTIIIHTPRPFGRFEQRRGGVFVWLTATAICATFIVWLAARDSSIPPVDPPSPSGPVAGASPPVPVSPLALRKADAEIARLRAELAAANADRIRLVQQLATQHKFQLPLSVLQPALPPVTTQNPPSLTPAPLMPQLPPLEISLLPSSPPVRPEVPPHPNAKWVGSWAYSHPRIENRSAALFPPDFIETVISEVNGRIRGEYRARFKVTRPRIAPDVNFRFEGKIAGAAGRFAWTGPGGARGEVQLRLVSDATLEVVWAASDLGTSMGLASGTAVLNRKN